MWWNWPPVGAWYADQRGRARWEGPAQKEDRSEESIRACYRFLRSVPYQTEEDRERLLEMENIAVADALLTM